MTDKKPTRSRRGQLQVEAAPVTYVPTKYLEPTDSDAFRGMRLKTRPDHFTVVGWCPLCQGYGGWHLQLAITGRHLNSHCPQCNGWGWVNQQDFDCIHKMKHTRNLGNCYNEYKCSECGKTENIDSSG